MTLMPKLLRTAVLLATAGLAACAAPFNGPGVLTDERLIYPITVAPHMETLRVPYSGVAYSTGGLTPDMDERLTAFARDYLEHGNGALSVSVPYGDESARRYYATRLSQLGVPAWRIMIGSSETASQAGAVELSYIRYAADSPPCGDWSSNYADTAANLPPPNFGCATQHNIAAMVADPRDLVAPRREDAADAARRMTVFDKYRKGLPTPTERTEDQKAAVSDISK